LPLVLLGVLLAGCTTPRVRNWDPEEHASPREAILISPGDQVRIEFFGAPELSSEQVVRRDGMVTLQLVGDVKVQGMTPEEAEAMLTQEYEGQLQVREISVVVTSLAPIYVSGAVLNPGPIASARSLHALEAIMEAGGFSPVANVRRVVVIRYVDGLQRSFYLDFKGVLEGRPSTPFYLEPADIVHVPEVLF
jgi:polysaccharide export outer membrane protein